VPAKHTGKKHGKGIVKPSDGFVSVAYDRVPGFTNRKDRRGARDPPAGSFHSLPHKCVNALFAADWADNRRRFDGELIVLHVHKALLISSGPRLIPREFNFVSDPVRCLSARSSFDKAHPPQHRLLSDWPSWVVTKDIVN
jgi:hypothetical protein